MRSLNRLERSEVQEVKASDSSITVELQNIRLLIQMQNSTQQDLDESQGMTGICNDPVPAPGQVKWRCLPPGIWGTLTP